MYLIDTNIFLEILLDQAKKDTCKDFLDVHAGELYLSDFSLHSIGVILFRNDSKDIFKRFIRDVLPKVDIMHLSKTAYGTLTKDATHFRMDFDDIYQFKITKEYGLTMVTMDKDFENVQHDIHVVFL